MTVDHEFAEEIGRRLLAKQLRTIRSQRHLSQRALAKRAGVKRHVVQRLENPHSSIGTITPSQIARIAFALGVRPKISFESMGSIPEATRDLVNPERLKRPTFEEEFPTI